MINKQLSTKDWIPIEKILDNGIILTKENNYIKIIKIKPINFNLKTELEKNSILKSYKEFLKICNFDIQIIIQSNKEDLTQIISKNEEQKKEKSEKIKYISDKYINFIKEININKKSASKSYYIIIKNKNNNEDYKIIIEELNEKYIKIKEALSKCGNKVINLNKEEIKEILFSFLNTRIFYSKN